MITPEQEQQILNRVAGYAMKEFALAEEMDISVDEIVEVMVDNGYERCSMCCVWVESCEVDEENEACKSCR